MNDRQGDQEVNSTKVLDCGCVMEYIDINGCMKWFLTDPCESHDREVNIFEPTPYLTKYRKKVEDYA